MAVNVKGILNCCKVAVAGMRAAGGESIVDVMSLAPTYGMPYALHYTDGTQEFFIEPGSLS